MLEDARRIVTGHDDAGSSVVVREGPLGKKHGAGDRWIAELWQTDGTTVDRQDEADVVPDTFSLYPPVGGTKFVLVSIAPDDPALTNEELEQRAADAFGGMGAADARVNTQRHPATHTSSRPFHSNLHASATPFARRRFGGIVEIGFASPCRRDIF
jgi:hypothetical protein